MDAETGLQYHRARWYDAAIGSWISTDPLSFNAGDVNLYRYVGNAPTNWTDPFGLAPNQDGTTDPSHLVDLMTDLESQGLSPSVILTHIKDSHVTNDNRYFYTDEYGWVDIRHFSAAADLAYSSNSSLIAELGGLWVELGQWWNQTEDGYQSAFSPEDLPSNSAGADFGDDYINGNEPLADSLKRWLKDSGARDQNDKLAGRAGLPKADPSVRGGQDSHTSSEPANDNSDADSLWPSSPLKKSP